MHSLIKPQTKHSNYITGLNLLVCFQQMKLALSTGKLEQSPESDH